ncbi:MAG TPA: hypothetical protein VFT87_05965 [Candidatus Saccharimonadales bacterium]|nr:hypothetical protein [Candidatus Saccharimonadales bacterium]
MPAVIFVAGIGLALFALAFVTKRRFGVLGLALAAGVLISTNWAAMLTPFLTSHGLTIEFIPLSVFVQASLILLPALLLLMSGPTYNGGPLRILGALAFTILAVTCLLQPLAEVLQLDGPSKVAYLWLSTQQNIVIVIGLSLAVVDLLFARSKHKGRH